MRHSNPNMSVPVLEGIAAGEAAVGSPEGDLTLEAQYELIRQIMEPADAHGFRVSSFLKAKSVARAQGFIGAYRASTEFNRGRARLLSYWIAQGATPEEAQAAALKVFPS